MKKKKVEINIVEFIKKFDELYDWLYDYGNEDEIDEAAQDFDRMVNENEPFKNLVTKFVEYRKDVISSDREAAAFIGTFEEMVL